MKYFKRFRFNIYVIILLFCTVPAVAAGVYFIVSGALRFQRVSVDVGVFMILYGLAAIIFGVRFISKLFGPLEKATVKLMSTLTDEEKEIFSFNSEKDRTKTVFAVADYIAGKRMVSGTNKEQKNLFSVAALCTDEIIWRRDEDGDSYFIPEIWKSRYPELSLTNGIKIESYVHPDNEGELASALEIMTGAPDRSLAISVQLAAGEKYISVGFTAHSALVGGMICAVGTLTDSEKIAEFETTIKEKYLMYNFALKAITDIIYEVDIPTDTYCVLNPDRWNQMFDIPLNGDFSLNRKDYAKLIHPDNLQGFLDRFGDYDHLLFMPDRSITYDYRIRHKNRDVIWVRHSITSVKDENGRVLKVIGNISDINEKKRQEFRELYDHKHDSLTGCFLRSTLEAEFNDIVKSGRTAGFVYMDIDNFRDIVDFYGQRACDIVLRQFVLRIWGNQLGKCSLGRVGNDDFVVILNDVNDWQNPPLMAERVLAAFSDPIKADNQQIRITVSVGSSVYGQDGTEFSELLEKSAAACREAHKSGTNKYISYADCGEEKV